MAIRPLGTLKQDQSRLLESIKADRGRAAEVVAGGGGADAAVFIGRVDAVVASDPTLGPHLRVVLVHLAGSPPVASDATTTGQVYYPAPGRAVSEYAVGEQVAVVAASGARLALKL